MSEKVMQPYSVYLPTEYIAKIKELAKERKAAALVRDAVIMMIDGDDAFASGYNKALRDVTAVIDACKEIEVIAIRGKYLADILAGQVAELKMGKN